MTVECLFFPPIGAFCFCFVLPGLTNRVTANRVTRFPGGTLYGVLAFLDEKRLLLVRGIVENTIKTRRRNCRGAASTRRRQSNKTCSEPHTTAKKISKLEKILANS